MRLPTLLALSTSLPFTVLAFGDAPCYYANGTQITLQYVRQCSDGVQSTCCMLNRDNAPGMETNGFNWVRDECLPNGLCQNRRVDNGRKITTFWAEYCTDSNITSGNCLDVCRHTRDKAGGSLMTACDAPQDADGFPNALLDDRETTRWCCGGSDACCTNNIDVVELPRNFTGRAVPPSTSSGLPTSTPSTSSGSNVPRTGTQTSTLAPESTPSTSAAAAAASVDDGLSGGAKAGIAISATVGVLAILTAAFFARKMYGYKRMAKQEEEDEMAAKYAQFGHSGPVYAGYPPVELPHPDPKELPDDRAPTELPVKTEHQSRV